MNSQAHLRDISRAYTKWNDTDILRYAPFDMLFSKFSGGLVPHRPQDNSRVLSAFY